MPNGAGLTEEREDVLGDKSSPRPPTTTIRLSRDLRYVFGSSQRLWVYYDAIAATVAAFLGFLYSPALASIPEGVHAVPDTAIPVYGVAFILASLILGQYELHRYGSFTNALVGPLFASAIGWTGTIIIHYALGYQVIGRWIVSIAGLATVGAAALPRLVMVLVWSRSAHRLVVVGTSVGIEELRSGLEKARDKRFVVARSIELDTQNGTTPDAGAIEAACAADEADMLLIERGCAGWVLDQAVDCIQRGIVVDDLSSFMENALRRVPVQVIGPEWAIAAGLGHGRPLNAMPKRLLDIVMGAVGLVLTLPLWPFIGLMTKLTSKGPIFYSQARTGRGGRPFRLLKFRTMVCDAEADGKAQWACEGDLRVTRFGRFLRKTRLDEVPQFLMVLRGTMSLVGPRPERPEFVHELAQEIPHYHMRHLVKPGITGWAQVSYPYGASVDDAREKLRYDLYYVKYCSLGFDLVIMLRTIGAVLKGSR